MDGLEQLLTKDNIVLALVIFVLFTQNTKDNLLKKLLEAFGIKPTVPPEPQPVVVPSPVPVVPPTTVVVPESDRPLLAALMKLIPVLLQLAPFFILLASRPDLVKKLSEEK